MGVVFSVKACEIFAKANCWATEEKLALDSPGVHVMCPTHWTVHAASLLSNYAALKHLWELAQDSTSDPTIESQIIGVESQFKKFSFFFGVHLTHLVLRHTDNLSKDSANDFNVCIWRSTHCYHDCHNTSNSPLWWPVFCLMGSCH